MGRFQTGIILRPQRLMWQSLFVPGIGFGEKIVRTLVVYLFLLIGLRLSGKRELSQLNPFDLVVLLLLFVDQRGRAPFGVGNQAVDQG